MNRFLWGCLLAGVSLSISAAPISPKSQITATFKQMKVPVEGKFTQVLGDITFDGKTGSGTLNVPTASFDLGMKDYNAEVRKAEWFDSKTYPHASFVVSKLTVQSATQALVEGTFTLKGKVQVLSLPVTIQGKRYSGQFNVSRKAFGLGSKDWDEVLDDTVLVKFVLVTK